MNSNVVDVEYIKSYGKFVTTTKELSPCYRYINELLLSKNYNSLNDIMEPNRAHDYSLLLCISLLRTTQRQRDKIKNWNKFKLVTQYLACESEDVTSKDLKTMFMGLWNE